MFSIISAFSSSKFNRRLIIISSITAYLYMRSYTQTYMQARACTQVCKHTHEHVTDTSSPHKHLDPAPWYVSSARQNRCNKSRGGRYHHLPALTLSTTHFLSGLCSFKMWRQFMKSDPSTVVKFTERQASALGKFHFTY